MRIWILIKKAEKSVSSNCSHDTFHIQNPPTVNKCLSIMLTVFPQMYWTLNWISHVSNKVNYACPFGYMRIRTTYVMYVCMKASLFHKTITNYYAYEMCDYFYFPFVCYDFVCKFKCVCQNYQRYFLSWWDD